MLNLTFKMCLIMSTLSVTNVSCSYIFQYVNIITLNLKKKWIVKTDSPSFVFKDLEVNNITNHLYPIRVSSAWTKGSLIKSNWYTYIKPKFYPQHLYRLSHNWSTPSYRGLGVFFWIVWEVAYMFHTCKPRPKCINKN